MQKFAFKLAFETPLRSVLPAPVKNVIYRQFIDSLRREAVVKARPDDIFNTPAMPCDRASHYKVWMLTSANDTAMAFWALKSLMHYSPIGWDVWLADGGMLPEHPALFERNFPNIRVISKEELDALARPALSDLPLCRRLRLEQKHPLAKKLIDPKLNISGRFFLLDSDVLFFSSPDEIIGAIADERVPFHFNMEGSAINSGVAVINPRAFSLSDVESYLASVSEGQRNRWTIEQDAYSALSKGRFSSLSSCYAVEPIEDAAHNGVTCCHYIGVSRHRFYKRGVMRLRSNGFLGLSHQNS